MAGIRDVAARLRALFRAPEPLADQLFVGSPMPMWFYDLHTLRFLDVNQAAVDFYGHSREEFLGMSVLEIRPAGEADGFRRFVSQIGTRPTSRYTTHLKKDGTLVRMAINSRVGAWNGRNARLVSAVDVTAQFEAEERLRQSEASLALAQEAARLGSYVWELQSNRVTISHETYAIYGVSPGELNLDRGLWPYDHPDDAERVEAEVSRSQAERRPFSIDHRIVRPDGAVRYVQERGVWYFDDQGMPTRLIGTVMDISERKEAEAALAFLAYHDPICRLPNRAGLNNVLGTMMTDERRPFAVFLFDLDRFKNVNDTLGHSAGDAVVREVGERLQHVLHRGETLARSGGDEFVVVAPNLEHRAEIARRAGQLLEAFSLPFKTGLNEHVVSASIGVSVFPAHGETAENLLRNAEVAMYAAKRRGGSVFHLYTDDLQTETERRFRLETTLRQALDRREFVLHYQPVVDRHGNVAAAEALLRWNDPARGLTSPAEFIEFAEEIGLIHRIGREVFEQALQQARSWEERGTPMRLWINLSATQLENPGLSPTLQSMIRHFRISPESIGLELTESSFIDERDDVLDTLRRIRDLGVQLALDDFGVKFSSLNYLRRLPIDVVKIDRIFVSDLTASRAATSIVKAIVSLAHDLGLTVTAEGVETAEQRDLLVAMGCDHWQGFLCSAAVTAPEFSRMLDGPARAVQSG